MTPQIVKPQKNLKQIFINFEVEGSTVEIKIDLSHMKISADEDLLPVISTYVKSKKHVDFKIIS